MRHLNRGQLLTTEELVEISTHIRISHHAEERMAQRGLKREQITNLINNPYIAYFNTDYSINIARDEFNYLVVVKRDYDYLIVTYKETSWNGININKKRNLAIKGLDR